jgi:hypothetical protein
MKTKITLKIDDKLFKEARKIAQAEGCSVSAWMIFSARLCDPLRLCGNLYSYSVVPLWFALDFL